MPDDRIKFSELSGVLTIDNNDIIAAAVQNGASETGFTSAKITIGQLSTKVAEGTTFSNLTTQNKYIVPAINEIKELISSIPQFDVQVVQTLPQTGITGTVYLVPCPKVLLRISMRSIYGFLTNGKSSVQLLSICRIITIKHRLTDF